MLTSKGVKIIDGIEMHNDNKITYLILLKIFDFEELIDNFESKTVFKEPITIAIGNSINLDE